MAQKTPALAKARAKRELKIPVRLPPNAAAAVDHSGSEPTRGSDPRLSPTRGGPPGRDPGGGGGSLLDLYPRD